MQFRLNHKHMIDFLFPAALFFVFALSAVTVILLAAEAYQSTIENSSFNYTSGTAMSYISEKIHQSDASDAVYTGSLDGYDALTIRQTHDGEVYYTYIYLYGQELKELFIKEGVKADVSSGQTILEVQDFTMEQIGENLFRFHCTDQRNQEASAIIGLKTS